ncbi:C4-type zinc ribbon domain-containing protein [Corynebacterium sp. 35RC1]|nr:C4-type zinc ribbon domain-containing protein [Corynebacterium sp. 35RC1]
MALTLDPATQGLLLELANLTRAQSVNVAQKKPEEVVLLERLQAKLARAEQGVSSAQMAVDDMELEVLRIQEDERKLRRRLSDSTQQLRAATDPELRRDLQHDVAAATSRINNLTGEMQEAHNELHALRQNVDFHGAKLDEARREVEAAQRAVDALGTNDEAQEDPAARIEELRAALPAEAVAAFDEERAINGVGVAEFNGRSCGGCFIVLPPADISAIKRTPANELPQCPDCSSYLVFSRS